MSSVPSRGLHQVWGGGTGFSIWKTAILKKTIPWKTSANEQGAVPGWDRDFAIKLAKLRLKTYVDAGIRCRHDNLPV